MDRCGGGTDSLEQLQIVRAELVALSEPLGQPVRGVGSCRVLEIEAVSRRPAVPNRGRPVVVLVLQIGLDQLANRVDEPLGERNRPLKTVRRERPGLCL